jgi:hypothetical protein
MLDSGGLQLAHADALIADMATATNAHPATPHSMMAVCAVQMGVFSIGSLASGGILVGFSRSLAHFVMKPVQTA